MKSCIHKCQSVVGVAVVLLALSVQKSRADSTGTYATPIDVLNQTSEVIYPTATGFPDATVTQFDPITAGGGVLKMLYWNQPSSKGKLIQMQIMHQNASGWRWQDCELAVKTLANGYPRPELEVAVKVVETDSPLPGDVSCTMYPYR